MSDLITRLEAATGPDRELDAAICIDLGLSKDNVMVGVDGWCINSETNPNPYKSPTFTASIDAALTLVPEGYYPIIDFAEVKCFIRDRNNFDHDPPAWCAKAPTPALAICIAALKARGEP